MGGSELPEDLLILIFANLDDVPNLVRAASVCSSWHRAYKSLIGLKLWEPQQHAPCLLYTVRSFLDSKAGLCSIVERKPYTLSLPYPPIRRREFIGSAFGWVITADDWSGFHLLNPITGDQIALPSITAMKHATPIYDENGALAESEPPDEFARSDLEDCYQKAFLSSDPSTGSYTVALIHYGFLGLSYARAGDHCWTPLPPLKTFVDCVFKGNLLYGLTQYGEIIEFDFSNPSVKRKVVLGKMGTDTIPPLSMHIVQTPCGDLLQIWFDEGYHLCDDAEEEWDSQYYSFVLKMFRVNLTSNKRKKIKSLGENVLFLGKNQSLCLRAQDHPRLKKNRIYFTDLEWFMTEKCEKGNLDIGVLNLDNNSREKFVVCPQIWSNRSSPLWITPNPRKAPQLALPEVASCCTTDNYFLHFDFGVLRKIRSICGLILKKASLYRER